MQFNATWRQAFTLSRWHNHGHSISETDYDNGDARKLFSNVVVEEKDFQGLAGQVEVFLKKHGDDANGFRSGPSPYPRGGLNSMGRS